MEEVCNWKRGLFALPHGRMVFSGCIVSNWKRGRMCDSHLYSHYSGAALIYLQLGVATRPANGRSYDPSRHGNKTILRL